MTFTKTKIAGVLLVGMLVGSILAFLAMGYQTRKLIALYAQVTLNEAAIDARQLAAGQSAAVLERKNAAVPHMVLLFEKEHAKYLPPAHRLSALWAAQRYYAENPSVVPPPDVKAILDGLPPRPPTSCELTAATTQAQPATRESSR